MRKFIIPSKNMWVLLFILCVTLFLSVSCNKKFITDRQQTLITLAKKGEHLQDEYLVITLLNDLKKGQFRIISTEEILKKLNEPEDSYIIIDARSETAYKKQHIRNAINIPTPVVNNSELPSDEVRAAFQADIASFTTNYTNSFIPIIVYADTLIDKRSNDLATALLNKGYRILYRYIGGYQAWLESGYPTE